MGRQHGLRAVAGDRTGYDPLTAKWELYNLNEDFSQANDLAASNPEKLKEMEALWWAAAAKYKVLPLDWRGAVPKILLDLGIRQIRLLTNNPKKVVGVDGYGLRIVERVPIQIAPNQNNRRYLQTKKDKLGHLLDEMDQQI